MFSQSTLESPLRQKKQAPMSQETSQRSAPTASASQTTTISDSSQNNTGSAPRILRLRGRHNANGRSVQWAEDVVDNEGLGRKSSKGI